VCREVHPTSSDDNFHVMNLHVMNLTLQATYHVARHAALVAQSGGSESTPCEYFARRASQEVGGCGSSSGSNPINSDALTLIDPQRSAGSSCGRDPPDHHPTSLLTERSRDIFA
jgi:hypothetical protein